MVIKMSICNPTKGSRGTANIDHIEYVGTKTCVEKFKVAVPKYLDDLFDGIPPMRTRGVNEISAGAELADRSARGRHDH